MEISFATEELKEVCLARAPEAGALPRAVIRDIHAFYHAMRNANHVAELPLGHPEQGSLQDDFTWRVNLVTGYGVIMRIDQDKVPMDGNDVDWNGIYRVLILKIEAPDA